jgi:hypothetical protein
LINASSAVAARPKALVLELLSNASSAAAARQSEALVLRREFAHQVCQRTRSRSALLIDLRAAGVERCPHTGAEIGIVATIGAPNY